MQITTLLTKLSNVAKDTCTGKTIQVQTAYTNPNQAPDSFNTCLPGVAANGSAVTTIIQIVFGIIGAIAIIYIMYGAFRYVRSQGEPQEINQARQTIIYAILGLVIAVSAETIVSFAIGRF